MAKQPTVADCFTARRGASGFEYLRLLLALAVLAFHCMTVTHGVAGENYIWSAWWRGLNALVLPMFFAMSGFLLAANLDRGSPRAFVMGRIARLGPALLAVVALCAFVLGPLISEMSLMEYLRSPMLWRYFLNLVGWSQWSLPGAFAHNPTPDIVNLPLWTLPYQFVGYALLLAAGCLGLTRSWGYLLAAQFSLHAMFTARDWASYQSAPFEEMPPKFLVLTFLYGVCLYVGREGIRLTRARTALAFALAFALSSFPQSVHLAPLPVAYATVSLGLWNPPRIWLVGDRDLAYGIYLYAFPLQQTAILLWPSLSTAAMLALAVPAALLSAMFSYHFIEKPCMGLLKERRAPRWASRTVGV